MSGLPSRYRTVARDLRLLALDVDGVLTDGRLYYSGDGETLKAFDVKDGLGLKVLEFHGVPSCVLSARASIALTRRTTELNIPHVFDNCSDKLATLRTLAAALEIPLEQIAFVGDDILDLPVLRAVGLAIAVADAHPLVRDRAHWVTEQKGGRGAVREICDAIVSARKGLSVAYDEYIQSLAKGKG